MKTKDITKTGIDRNFLRKCISKKIITPKKLDNEWIIDKRYVPQDYTQEDLEKVWHAYLCRKMGLSYSQIAALTKGEEISFRKPLNTLIQKYEEQILELQSLISVMKYVKGLGFIPASPSELMGSSDFKTYLSDLIEYLGRDKRLKTVLSLAESISEVENFDAVDSNTLDSIETLCNGLSSKIHEDDCTAYSSVFFELMGKSHLSPSCDEVQDTIHQIFYCHKQIVNNESLTPWEFASRFIFLLSCESDISIMYKKLLGEEKLHFFVSALVEFLIIQEPDKINQLKSSQENKN